MANKIGILDENNVSFASQTSKENHPALISIGWLIDFLQKYGKLISSFRSEA